MPKRKKKETRRKEAAKQRQQEKLQTNSDEQTTGDVEADAAMDTTEETEDIWDTGGGAQQVKETTSGAEGHQFDIKDSFSPNTMALPASQQALKNYHQDPEYKNFQKAGLCFYKVKEVLEPCVEDVSKALHRELMSLSKSCKCMHTKLCRNCQNQWKAKMQGFVVEGYVINWTNKDIFLQPKQHWSVAKCFVEYDQTDKDSASHCDISPLLTFIVNCNRFKEAEFGHIQEGARKVRKDRNQYIHRGTPKISNKELQDIKKNMINFLKNQKLKATGKADEAQKFIEMVCDVNYIILLEDEVKAELSCLKGQVDRICSCLHSDNPQITSLDRQVCDLGRKLKELDEKKADKSEFEKLRKEIVEKGDSLKDLEQRVTTLEGRVEKIEDQQCSHHKMSQEDMDQLKEDLLSSCKRHTTIPLSHFSEDDETIPFGELYNDVIIKVRTKEQTILGGKRLSSFKQMFPENDMERIIITGLSGCGKTTFCKKIIHTWCKEQCKGTRRTSEKIDTDDEEVISDEEILSKFMFLFYIYTPKIADESELYDVLCNQCVHNKQDQFKQILEEHPEKCLIILDGIDEMGDKTPLFLTKLLERNLYPRITVLMVMRPWKISKLGLKLQSHYDLLLDVQGLSDNNVLKLVEKVIDINCRLMKKNKLPLTLNEKQVFSSFKTIPLLLLFLAHIWFQDQSLPKRRKDLYKKILECFIQRCIRKNDKYVALAGQDITVQTETFWRSYLDSAGKVAHHFLLKENNVPSVVMQEKDLMIKLEPNAQLKLSALLDCGVLSKEHAYSPLEKKNVLIKFIHLSIQEYLTALYLVSNDAEFQNFLTSLTTLIDVLRFENLFIFISGLDVNQGCKAFSKICQVCDQDPQVQQYRQEVDYLYLMLNESVVNLNHMYKVCLHEMDEKELVELSDLFCLDESTYRYIMARLKPFCLKSLTLQTISFDSGEEIQLSHQTNLTSLTLFMVKISKECSGSQCRSISGCTQLENLHIEYMTLYEGVLNLSTLTNLTSLKLYKVTMSEECCRELCSTIINCTLLNKLYLLHIILHDAVLNLSTLTKLTSLVLGNVIMSEECSKSLCSSVSGCTNLKELELIRNRLHDSVLDLMTLTNLTSLTLCKVTMSEECSTRLCSSIRCCTDLNSLNLENIALHDVLDLSTLTKLTSIRLRDVTMSEECSTRLCDTISSCCTQLVSIYLKQINLHNGVLNMKFLKNLKYLTTEGVNMSTECASTIKESSEQALEPCTIETSYHCELDDFILVSNSEFILEH